MSFWKILRVLVTDSCNYRCVYCHNEGQKVKRNKCLGYNEFVQIFNKVNETSIHEIRFSGGEPLTNPEILKMIEYVRHNSDMEIGVATNGSLISDNIAKQFMKFNVLVTVHLPTVDKDLYQTITGQSIEFMIDGVKLLVDNAVNYSFNHVLYFPTTKYFNQIIDSNIVKGRRLKILPFLDSNFHNKSASIIPEIVTKVDSIALKKEVFLKEGIVRWDLPFGTSIKLLQAPCYNKDLIMCKNYAEVRLLPNLRLKKCIFDTSNYKIDLEKNETTLILKKMWKDFNSCCGEREV